MPEWRGAGSAYGSRGSSTCAKDDRSLATLKALVLIDMIGDHDLDDPPGHRLPAYAWPKHSVSFAEAEACWNLDDHFVAESDEDRGRPPVPFCWRPA